MGKWGKNTDKTFIQSKILNFSKGPAVYSLRAQVDRRQYQSEMKHTLELQENLDIRQAEVVEILTDESKTTITGIKTHTGAIFKCKAIILTTGTYLQGRIILGEVSYSGGPDGLFPANKLSGNLVDLGITLLRFKTGTPARLNRRSVDFSKMFEQPGDDVIIPFSFETESIEKEQVSCWLTYTNNQTHEVIKQNLHRSPLYSGTITGVGPRYCPSIEDKVVRFADKERHQVFVEPMGLDTEEMYLQGMSSSLPEDVQIEFMKTIPGLENVKVMRSAYAIEYDGIDATQLKLSLEYKNINGLFSAGQINGSSGYEEAAAQGIVAGINAAMLIQSREPMILDRSQAYIGVLIDDLVTKGTKEPYRMMTSRSEYRLLLRQDNADLRLTPIAKEVGLINSERFEKFLQKKELVEKEIERIENIYIPPSEKVLAYLESRNSAAIKSGFNLAELLRRPEISYDSLGEVCELPELPRAVREQVEVTVKYKGYIKRQIQQVEQYKKLEGRKIPQTVDYAAIQSLRLEAKQKLTHIRPDSIGQASRITGVSPADISVLLIYLEQMNRKKN